MSVLAKRAKRAGKQDLGFRQSPADGKRPRKATLTVIICPALSGWQKKRKKDKGRCVTQVSSFWSKIFSKNPEPARSFS